MGQSLARDRHDPIISCEDLCVAYGREEVLHDVCLEIEGGSFLPFIGPNGAGKTTLLRTILGFIKPRKGMLVTPFRRQVPGYVPQQKSIDPLYPVSLRQIVMMGLYPQIGWWRTPNIEQRAIIEQALEQFDLTDHDRKTFGELSGGMKQKALIARAFVSGADVFILDEPTSELDEPSERAVLAHLFRLSRDEGKTVLLAHHGVELVEEMASQVCLVHQGQVRIAANENVKSPNSEATSVDGELRRP